jgi:hypothetical protein
MDARQKFSHYIKRFDGWERVCAGRGVRAASKLPRRYAFGMAKNSA